MKTKRNNLLTYKVHKEEETKLAQAAPAMISYNKHTNTHSLTYTRACSCMFGAAFGVAVQPVPVRPVDDALDSPQLTLWLPFLLRATKDAANSDAHVNVLPSEHI